MIKQQGAISSTEKIIKQQGAISSTEKIIKQQDTINSTNGRSKYLLIYIKR